MLPDSYSVRRLPAVESGTVRWSTAAFTIMGTRATLTVGGADPEPLIDFATFRLSELEARWSRFIETSEISALNRSNGEVVPVSEDTLILVESAIKGWRVTSGDFDPTVLDQLVSSGYDRSFLDLTDGAREHFPPRPEMAPRTLGCAAIVVDLDRSTVCLPSGVGFDPGGIGKGLAADVIARELMSDGAAGACVDIGGDVRVIGVAPGADGWPITIDVAGRGRMIDRTDISLRDGAVATSSPSARTWMRDGRHNHHLIDPHTGSCTGVDITSVTVVAAHGWQAEVLTKSVFVRGVARGLELVQSLGADALIVAADGMVRRSDGWQRFARSTSVR